MNRRRFAPWHAFVFVALLGLGLVVTEVIGPTLISDAYHGRSLPILNDVITGQEQLSLEVYQAQWRGTARGVLVALTLLGLAVYARWLFRPALGALGKRIFRGEFELSPAAVLWLAAWFGAVSGLVQTLYFTVRHLIERHPAAGFTWELVWMGPISSTLAFILSGVVLLLVVRLLVPAGRRLSPVALPICVFAFALPAAYGPLRNPRLGLAGFAVVLLSLGIATQLSRLSRSRSPGFLRHVRLSSPPLAVLMVCGLVAGLWVTPSRLEQRRLADLLPVQPGLPNVLLIILDTVRSQNLSLYGYDRPTTPSLERLAEDGVTFDWAVATSPWTLPSHASMFTGRFHFEVSADIGIPLDGTHPTLAEVLRRDGYATAAFTANRAYTTTASGLARGFARYEDLTMGWAQFLTSSWLADRISHRLLDLRAPRWRLGRKTADLNTDDFLAWLSSRPDRPFFAFLNYIDAHDPYTAPEPFASMFAQPGLPPKVTAKTRPVTEEEMLGSVAAYDGAIAFIDQQLARLFEELRDEGILDNTLVIVASDHGEQFGEHGLMLHTNSLYMPLLRVPLVILYPSGVPASRRIEQPVSIRDIPATVLELIHGRPDHRLPGSSLSRFWDGTPEEADAREEPGAPIADPTPLLSEVNKSVNSQPWEPGHRGSMKSLLINGLHYIRNGDGVEEVYDLADDPGENRNLADEPGAAAPITRARSVLDSILAAREPTTGRLD